MVQPCLDPSLPINNHVTSNCTAREARGSRSTLHPPFPPFTLWIIPVLVTGLSRALVCEYFKGTSGCYWILNEQRAQEVISRKNQGTWNHYKTHTVNTPLLYSLWWSGTSKKSGLIQEMKRGISPSSRPSPPPPPRWRMFLAYKLVPDRSREYEYNLDY